MALTRLLRAKQSIHFSRIGYTNSTIWYSSSASHGEIDKSTSSKKGRGAREQKEKAVESYVNKYMEENPGVFPKPSYVHKQIGGSWYNLKDILQNLKEKILGNNNTQLHDPNPNIDSKATNGPDKIEVNGDKITVSPILKNDLSGNTMNQTASKATEKGDLGNLDRNPNVDSKATNGLDKTKVDRDKITVSSMLKDTQSRNTTTPPASKSITENGRYWGNVELNKSESSVESSVKTKDSVVESKIVAKILREEIVQANNRSDILKLFDFKTGEKVRPPNVPGGIKVNFDSNLISNSDKLSLDKLRDSFVERLRDIGYGNQDGRKMNNSSSKLSNFFTNLKKSEPADKHSEFTKSQDTTKTFQELVEMKLTSNGYKNNQSSPSKGPPQKEALIQTNEKLTPVSSQEYSPSGEAKSSDLKGLVDCIKVLPVRLEGRIVNNSTYRDKEGVDPNVNALDRLNSTRVPLKMTEKELNHSQRAGQNKIKLMFLPKTATKVDIYNAFRSCGDVESVEFVYSKKKNGSGLSASVCFKTVKGMKKALEKRHIIIQDQEVTVEEAPSPTTDSSPAANTLPVPNVISDAFSGLIKNPKRTVVIEPLTPDICYHHLEEALSFCQSKISAVLFGSSKSIAYVEFKTEEGKEKALTKHSIDVFGKQLSITRIDAPRTTVVRLSNLASSYEIIHKLKPICESFGRITAVKFRHSSLLDVYFELNEWPNMLNIVNRLNGMEIGAERLVAAPAPIFPPEILRALWNHPDEKRHVKAVVRALIQKFGESSINMVALADTAAKLYRD